MWIYVCAIATCSADDGSGSCHAPAPLYFEEITHCRRQKLHWRWPGNPNGRSKFRNLGLFMFTRSQLTLRRRLRGWWWLPEIANGTLPTSKTSKFRKYENLWLWDQAKRLKNVFLLLRTTPRLAALHTVYFPFITRNGFCVHIRKIISRRLWPPPKNRDIQIVVFFCRFYL